MSGGEWATTTERRAAARDAYLRSAAAGLPPTGAELGGRFDRSERWGRERIAECQHHLIGNPPAAATDGAAAGSESDTGAAPGGDDGDRPGRGAVRAQRIDTLTVGVVALVAAVASYEHQRGLAELAGEGYLAWVLPLSVDGMMLATSRSILRRRRAGLAIPALSWFGLLLGFVASVAANVAAAEPTLIGRLLAAWPPIALFVAYETLAADHGEFRP